MRLCVRSMCDCAIAICDRCAIDVRSVCDRCAIDVRSVCDRCAIDVRLTCDRHAIGPRPQQFPGDRDRRGSSYASRGNNELPALTADAQFYSCRWS